MAEENEHGKFAGRIKPALDATKAKAKKLSDEADWVFGRRTWRVLGVVALFAVVVALLFLLLNWYVSPTKASDKKDLVLALAQILAGTALLSGIYFTWRTLQVNREGQITERFTRAIDQLGSNEIEIRLGGIYALGRIARDSERDRSTITQVLSAYVRTNSFGKGGKLSGEELELSCNQLGPDKDIVQYQHQKLDVQAALDVIRLLLDLSEHHKDISGRRPLYLNNTDLKFADLRKANLEEASIRNANLLGARLDDSTLEHAHLRTTILVGARLRRTNFERADLEEVNFDKAHLQGARFKDAKLGSVTFSGANLDGADLDGADLRGANLDGADLRGATHLTQPQLENTRGDKNTRLPPGFTPPAHWRGEKLNTLANFKEYLPGPTAQEFSGSCGVTSCNPLIHDGATAATKSPHFDTITGAA